MNNQIILIGRLVKTSEETTENGAKKVIITIATPQYFKNINGEYDTNFFNISLFGTIAQNTIDWVNKGDLIGIRGRLQRIDLNKPVELIAEKITFLSSKRKDEEEA